MRVPDEAGVGMATVKVSFPTLKTVPVAAGTFQLKVKPADPAPTAAPSK